jgi:hypothetical protein
MSIAMQTKHLVSAEAASAVDKEAHGLVARQVLEVTPAK